MVNYRKSSFSMANGNCIEVGSGEAGSRSGIMVRDSTDQARPAVKYTVEAWEMFIAEIKAR